MSRQTPGRWAREQAGRERERRETARALYCDGQGPGGEGKVIRITDRRGGRRGKVRRGGQQRAEQVQLVGKDIPAPLKPSDRPHSRKQRPSASS
eukprot:44237-Rhodomonas_salina.1